MILDQLFLVLYSLNLLLLTQFRQVIIGQRGIPLHNIGSRGRVSWDLVLNLRFTIALLVFRVWLVINFFHISILIFILMNYLKLLVLLLKLLMFLQVIVTVITLHLEWLLVLSDTRCHFWVGGDFLISIEFYLKLLTQPQQLPFLFSRIFGLQI